MAALPGVYRTAVGFCGGKKDHPSYKLVCSDPEFDDYAEAITVDYHPSVLSYEDVLEAFFRSHDAISGRGRSRQYASVIFTHDDAQREVAERVLASQPRASTSVEPVGPFWEAESYHQKFLLQRKRPLMLALGLTSYDELLGPAPTILNAVAGGHMRVGSALARLEVLVEDGELADAAHAEVRAVLEDL